MSLIEEARPPGKTRRRFTKAPKADAVALVFRPELVRLRRENAKLKIERELLKKATAFQVLESPK